MAKLNIKHAVKTVTTAGTKVALGTSAETPRKVRALALSTNTGLVGIGGSTMSMTNCFVLAPGKEIDLHELFFDRNPNEPEGFVNLSELFVDAATNGDKLSLVYFSPN